MINLLQNNLKKAVCIFSLLIVLMAISGCGEKEDIKVEGNETQTFSVEQTESPALQIGQAGKTDTLEITVTKAEKALEWINATAEGREYVVVAFKISNISKEEQSVGAGDFQYINDESGSREAYARATGVKAEPKTFGAADIAPGDTFEGSLVYAVPVKQNRIELHYIKRLSAKPALRFEFNK